MWGRCGSGASRARRTCRDDTATKTRRHEGNGRHQRGSTTKHTKHTKLAELNPRGQGRPDVAPKVNESTAAPPRVQSVTVAHGPARFAGAMDGTEAGRKPHRLWGAGFRAASVPSIVAAGMAGRGAVSYHPPGPACCPVLYFSVTALRACVSSASLWCALMSRWRPALVATFLESRHAKTAGIYRGPGPCDALLAVDVDVADDGGVMNPSAARFS